MQEQVTILNKRGEKLVGVLHEAGTDKLVVLCHGFRSSKDTNTISYIAAALANEGISAFRFDFSGNGESEGTFQYANYHGEVEDLRSVIEYFNGLNRPTVVVLGHSKGGNVVLLYASKYHDIPGVVNISGRYDLKKGIQERLGKDFMERVKNMGFIEVKTRMGEANYRITEADLNDRMNTDMHEACRSIDEKCKVLTIHGTADEVIPMEDAHEFAKVIPNHQLKIIEGADHCYISHLYELALLVLPFVNDIMEHGEDVPK